MRICNLLPMCVAMIPACVAAAVAPGDTLRDEREVHLRNVRQLTFGGENAEAYWSADGKQLILQSKRGELQCDQIFVLEVGPERAHMVSTGKGRTTCSYFFPDGRRILYASTHAAAPECPRRCRTTPRATCGSCTRAMKSTPHVPTAPT